MLPNFHHVLHGAKHVKNAWIGNRKRVRKKVIWQGTEDLVSGDYKWHLVAKLSLENVGDPLADNLIANQIQKELTKYLSVWTEKR